MLRGLLTIVLLVGLCAPSQAEEEVTDPEQIKIFQRIMFAWGWDTYPDGIIGPKTREAILVNQKTASDPLPVDGRLTPSFLQRTIEGGYPKDFIYAALSASTDGAAGWTFRASDRLQAHDRAQAECRRRSSRRADCLTISTYFTGRREVPWIGAVYCYRVRHNGVQSRVSIQTGGSWGEVFDKAMLAAEISRQSTCKTIVAISVDGQVKR